MERIITYQIQKEDGGLRAVDVAKEVMDSYYYNQ